MHLFDHNILILLALNLAIEWCVLYGVHFCFFFRLINPVVVAPTIAAVGLSFYSYGFPLVGTCLEIGAAQILLVVIFSLVSFRNSFMLFVSFYCS